MSKRDYEALARELLEQLEIAVDCMRTTEETEDDGASDICIEEAVKVLGKARKELGK